MAEPVQALEQRVDRLEGAIADGLSRIENLLRQQIQDIKAEQIADLKDRYVRLADDQRRVWEAVRELEKARYRGDGRMSVAQSLWGLLTALVGGGLVAAVNFLFVRH